MSEAVDLPPTPDEIEAARSTVDSWLAAEVEGNPAVAEAAPDPESDRRWMVRLLGEEKEHFTVWFELRQRSLRAETYLMPAPMEDHAAVYEYLLRTAEVLRGVTISIGAEDALFAHCEFRIEFLDERQLDRMLGSLHEVTERVFVPAMRLGFGDRFSL
ncbi:MAG: hypothetical protein ACR2OH_02225 [Microthrixaceae bacterium]